MNVDEKKKVKNEERERAFILFLWLIINRSNIVNK